EDPADGLDRESGQSPRSRAPAHVPVGLRVELRLVARASEHLRLLFPPRDVTRRVGANRGVRDNAFRRARSSFLRELIDAQPENEDLIEARSVSHEPGPGIHWIRDHERPERNILQGYDRADTVA